MNKRLKEIFGTIAVPDLETYITIIPVNIISVYKGFAVYGVLYGAIPIKKISINAPSNDFFNKVDIINYIKFGINNKYERQKKLIRMAEIQIEFANKMEKKINNMKKNNRNSCQMPTSKLSEEVSGKLSDWVCNKHNVRKKSDGELITFYN